ncbi:MAG: hypothetical protein KAS21_00375 [Candidatus Aminicenantes bacterium]|nr:hypothetical protein [Candidatus Aminicenantes bacterium]MCK5003509.1 hypothetical protein [Candidatus Aminicenantes bacterium]
MKKRQTDSFNVPENALCPFCGSANILPFEDDSGTDSDLPVFIIILTALIVVALYLAFVVASYMYFPVVVFIAIIISTRVINRQEKKPQRKILSIDRDFICLSCNSNFNRADSV